MAAPHPTKNSSANFEQKIEDLAKLALAFASENPSLLTWDMNEDRALNILFDFIIDTDKELSEAELIHGLSPQGAIESPKKRLRSEEQYFCSRFTQWLQKANPEVYDVLSDVGNAVMISEVIMELREPSFSPDKQGGLLVYLDAPLCMEILGCSGTARKDDSSYLLSRLKHFGAQVLIFSHSVEEIRANLNAVLKNRPGERRGPTASALIRHEVPEDHLYGVLRDTDRYLKEAGIEIYQTDRIPLPPNQMQAFPDDYKQDLLSKLQQHYKRFEAAERDALSATIVMRRRNRHRSSDLFRVKHVMITRNPMVATVCKRFCQELGLIDANQFSPIVQARQAAALVWFAVGSDQKKELSRRQLVLSCSKAIESTPRVIEQLRKKLAEMRPENADTFDALIREPRNLQVAMDFAQGSEARAVESDPEVLLSKLTDTLTAEERRRHRLALSDIKSKHKEELAEKAAVEDELKNRIGALELAEQQRIDNQLRLIESTFSAFYRRCQSAIWIARIAFAFLTASLAFITSSIFLEDADKAWVEGWTLGLSFIAALLAAVAVFVDPVKLIERAVMGSFARRFEKRIRDSHLEEARSYITIDWTKPDVTINQGASRSLT